MGERFKFHAAICPILRRLGYERTHIGGPMVLYEDAVVLGSEARLAHTPTVARCGTELRGNVVLMREETPIRCPACRRISARIDGEVAP